MHFFKQLNSFVLALILTYIQVCMFVHMWLRLIFLFFSCCDSHSTIWAYLGITWQLFFLVFTYLILCTFTATTTHLFVLSIAYKLNCSVAVDFIFICSLLKICIYKHTSTYVCIRVCIALAIYYSSVSRPLLNLQLTYIL